VWVCRLIEQHPFGLLVTADGEYQRISHIPIVAQQRGDELWLIGHVARANPHARAIVAQEPATLVFQGPHGYVSAAWYEEPYATVPTWNYTAAHVRGRLRQFDAGRAVELLSAAMEGQRTEPWDFKRLDASYREKQLRAIVAFELRAEAIFGKAKLSQNRTLADRERVIERLSASADQNDRDCAAAMRGALASEMEQG
jgi:transcriptional regulator